MEDASAWQQKGSDARDERDRQRQPDTPAADFICPLCKSDSYEAIPAYRGADLLLYKCARCTLTFTNPRRFMRRAA